MDSAFCLGCNRLELCADLEQAGTRKSLLNAVPNVSRVQIVFSVSSVRYIGLSVRSWGIAPGDVVILQRMLMQIATSILPFRDQGEV